MDKVEEFTDLKSLSGEKLIKLRDIAVSDLCRLNQEVSDATDHLTKIVLEIQNRSGVHKNV